MVKSVLWVSVEYDNTSFPDAQRQKKNIQALHITLDVNRNRMTEGWGIISEPKR